jgi:catalase
MNTKKTCTSGKRKQKKCLTPNGDTQPTARGELHQIAGGEHPALTTNQGLAISDNQNSLRANPLGPTLLEDFILREKIISITSVFQNVSFTRERREYMDSSSCPPR